MNIMPIHNQCNQRKRKEQESVKTEQVCLHPLFASMDHTKNKIEQNHVGSDLKQANNVNKIL